jgi:hypothetical protein
MNTEVPMTFDELWIELERRLKIRLRPDVRRWAEAKYGHVMVTGDSASRLTLLELLQQDLARMRVGGVQIAEPEAHVGRESRASPGAA